MRVGGIDFPDRLIAALRSDELVVFAGAGVSMGAPAGLPDFDRLAAAVAAGTSEAQEHHEPAERFFGRLKSNGIDVHQRAADKLREHEAEPATSHLDLLRLSRTPQAVRVVTTNYDALFEQAAARAFDGDPAPAVFAAPALPLGTRFRGIVHLHGSLDHPEEMVLTDADFGRAYLTEGWARRFLADLFRSYTVLFVGYSHCDTVMNYLSRALPPDARKRYVLTDKPDDPWWQMLGVESIGYTKERERDHSHLWTAVKGLADDSRRGVLDWEREIGDIAKHPPSLDGEAMDRIGDALFRSDSVPVLHPCGVTPGVDRVA